MVPLRGDILRMIGAAAATGSLIPNGHYGFWNRARPRDNEAVRLFAQACR